MDTVMYSVQKKEETKNEEGNVQETQRTKPQLKSECSCANIGLHPLGSAYRSALSPSMISSDEQTTEDDLTPTNHPIQPPPHPSHPPPSHSMRPHLQYDRKHDDDERAEDERVQRDGQPRGGEVALRERGLDAEVAGRAWWWGEIRRNEMESEVR